MKPRSTALATPAGRAGPLAGTLRAGIAAVLVSAAIGLAGCTPDPAPQPTPTPLFASEAEAFTAAEQVYRDYTDASNERRDGKADADPQQYLAGAALEDEITVQRQLETKKLVVVGSIRVISFTGTSFERATSRVSARVCLDVKDARVVDSSGADVTPSARQEVGLLEVKFTRSGDGLVIVESKSLDMKC
ncbi:hypothetical protein [Microbacterium sp.]|uniref:hypothetical protein n=1 Tax=Microbacterium sp. TaxID=51671 RepID=UPI001AC777AF|nr:hypothetical protein [Microbacterium sp.]MBN9159077.1 hypothetical protein [Microbacterium sp.]